MRQRLPPGPLTTCRCPFGELSRGPRPLAERVAAATAQLAKHFHRAKPADLAEILETLATLGRAHREGEKFTR